MSQSNSIDLAAARSWDVRTKSPTRGRRPVALVGFRVFLGTRRSCQFQSFASITSTGTGSIGPSAHSVSCRLSMSVRHH